MALNQQTAPVVLSLKNTAKLQPNYRNYRKLQPKKKKYNEQNILAFFLQKLFRIQKMQRHDGLNQIVFVDDSQIVRCVVEKFCEQPRTEIEIFPAQI